MERTSPQFPISSKDNRAIKFLMSLSDQRVRKTEKHYLIEGVKMVEEALRDKAGVKQVVACPSLTQHQGKGLIKLAEMSGIDILWISERLLDGISESKTPQPVMAVVRLREYAEETLLAVPPGLAVICNRLQDPGNLGTIIRTAEAVGAAGVIVTQNTVDAYNPKTVRASMGSILRLPVLRTPHVEGFLAKCRRGGFQTVALVLNARTNCFDLDLTMPTVTVLGQEGSGLPEEILEHVDHQARVPMAESIDSLNVATSAAVVLYEAWKQRRKRSGPR
jgi:TrmH family RNA methyltransferase